tara:strand:- start:597 stop:857 length:261 start_codon:yes stop_codon:yes gene_type:complete
MVFEDKQNDHEEIGLLLLTAPKNKVAFCKDNIDSIVEQLQVSLFRICGLSQKEIDSHKTLPSTEPAIWLVNPTEETPADRNWRNKK